MTDREALYRAILLNPEDDTPRLIYADYLDDFGDEKDRKQAEYIRLCVKLGDNDGEYNKCPQYFYIDFDCYGGLFPAEWVRERNSTLIWLGSPEPRHLIGALSFSRGFPYSIDYISLSLFMLHARTFFLRWPIQEVHFHDPDGTILPEGDFDPILYGRHLAGLEESK